MLLPKLRVVVSSFPGPQRAQSECLHPGLLEGSQQREEAGGQPSWKGGPKHREETPAHTLSHPPPTYPSPHPPPCGSLAPEHRGGPPVLMRGYGEGGVGGWPHHPVHTHHLLAARAPWEAGQG